MDHTFCPGARTIRQPSPETIACPSCKNEVEIWSDELRTTCPQCHATVTRSNAMACLDWCKMGKECVGEEAYGTYMTQKAVTVKDALIDALESFFGEDRKRINHAKEVLVFAEELLLRESGDWHIVIPAALLHDVGIKPSEEKYGSSAGHYQEIEGPPIARRILLKQGVKLPDIEEICAIIAHHHSPAEGESRNFMILYDADCLVNIGETAAEIDKSKMPELIERTFLSAAGKEMARQRFL